MDVALAIANQTLDRIRLISEHRTDIDALWEKLDFIEKDDQELLAYLRATKFVVNEARSRIIATYEWRKECAIAEKMKSDSWRAAERGLRSVLLYDYLGTDQHGRPVLVERVGAWDVAALLEATKNLEDFKTLHAMADETLAKMPRPAGIKDPRGCILIMDLKGLGRQHLRPRLATVFGAVNQIDERFYPDSVAEVFVVNAPSIFSSVLSIIKRFLNTDTLTKMHFSSDVPATLADSVGKECLPVELGGHREGVFPYRLTAASKYPE